MRRVNTAAKAPRPVRPLTVGFCTDRNGEAELRAAGIERIWMRGRGMESADWAISWLRGRPGVLAVASDLRCFGPTRKEIFARTADLARRGITLRDVRQPGLNAHELEERTLASINAASGMGNRRTARRRGAKGGTAKGVAAWVARNEIAPEWLLRNMVAELGAKRTAALLDNKISASTLLRKYRAAA